MKTINASYRLIDDPSITKKIEKVARVCYKSEDKIDEGTDMIMCRSLIKRQHTAMLEHASLVLEVGEQEYSLIETLRSFMENMIEDGEQNRKCYLRYTNSTSDGNNYRYFISGNIRAWYEFMIYANSVNGLPKRLYNIINDNVNNIFDIDVDAFDFVTFDMYDEDDFYAKVVTDMNQLTDEERMVHETFSVLFTVDRGVTHELVRMRDCSFAQESTRYCNYANGKFGNEITVVLPCFFDTGMGTNSNSLVYKEWELACKNAEASYFKLLEYGAKPQEARDVLPTSVKADIVMTTNLAEWKHIFNLRACDSTGPAHPQMKEVMIPLFKEMREKYPFAFGDMVAADEVTK